MYGEVSITFVSSIHLERMNGIVVIPQRSHVPESSSTRRHLIIAGNLGDPFIDSFSKYIQLCSLEYDSVVVVPGPLEYSSPLTSEGDVERRVEEVCNSFSNVYYLNRITLIIDFIKYVGCTFWDSSVKDKHGRDLQWMSRALCLHLRPPSDVYNGSTSNFISKRDGDQANGIRSSPMSVSIQRVPSLVDEASVYTILPQATVRGDMESTQYLLTVAITAVDVARMLRDGDNGDIYTRLIEAVDLWVCPSELRGHFFTTHGRRSTPLITTSSPALSQLSSNGVGEPISVSVRSRSNTLSVRGNYHLQD